MLTATIPRSRFIREPHHRASEWYGLYPTKTTAKLCPRIVAGLRCQRYSKGHEQHSTDPCVCLKYYSTLLDHARLWSDGKGNRVLTGEPYGLYAPSLKEFILDMTSLGLRVSFAPHSIWNPGRARMIIISSQEST